MRTLIFITPNLTQPRCVKRVEAFHKKGWKCVVYGYTRGIYDVNSYADGIEVQSLSGMTSANDSRKFKRIYSDVRRIISDHKDEEVVYYAFGMLPALSFRLSRKPYIYEISDIMYAYPRFRRVEWLFKWIDRSLIRRSLQTAMTSEGFRSYLGVPAKDIVLLQNKVNPALSSYHREALAFTDRFRFGFVGAIRYESILRFAEVIAEEFPQHEFHFFGGTGERMKGRCLDLVKCYKNVHYHGPFVNPDDLPGVYGQLDIVVACYDVSSVNERIAEPNKLFEAMFFCRPIVVSEGIFLAEQVRRFGCGYTIDATRKESIRAFVKSLEHDSLSAISSREREMPSDELVDNSDSFVDRMESLLQIR